MKTEAMARLVSFASVVCLLAASFPIPSALPTSPAAGNPLETMNAHLDDVSAPADNYAAYLSNTEEYAPAQTEVEAVLPAGETHKRGDILPLTVEISASGRYELSLTYGEAHIHEPGRRQKPLTGI